MVRKILLTLLFTVSALSLAASHAIGGMIIYECLGNDKYKFKINRYRDLAGVNYPNSFDLRIRAVDGSGAFDITLPLKNNYSIPILKTHPCHDPPAANQLVGKYIYESDTVTLQPGTNYEVYDLSTPPAGSFPGICCRNNGIINISNSSTQSQILYAEIPDPGQYPCNSSPTFDTIPPVEVCVGTPISIDHSATDPDGDSLAYEFCPALQAEGSNPPVAPIQYDSGYSASYPIESNPAINIDSQTGKITGTPTEAGIHVVKVCVKEYRNDSLIGEYGREFLISVAYCENSIASISTNQGDSIVTCSPTVDFNTYSGGNYHFWQFDYPNGTDTSVQQYPTYTYPDTGTYTAMYVSKPGQLCADTAFATVVIKDSLSVANNFLSTGSDKNICPNDTTKITASGASAYEWITTGTFCDTCSSTQVAPGNNTTYTVKGVKEGCVNYDSVKVETRPIPNDLIAEDSMVRCEGATIQLQAQSANSYQWDSSSALSCTNCPNSLATPDSNTWFYVTGTDSFGCTGEDSVLVEYRKAPSLQIIPSDTAICKGTQVELEAVTSAGSFLWSNGDTTQITTVAPNQNTNYIVTATDNDGCASIDTAIIQVNILQPGSFIGDTSMCKGDSVQLFANGWDSYQWSPAATLTNDTISNPIAYPDTTTNYKIVVEDLNGCKDSSLVKVTVDSLPNITTSPDKTLCSSDTTSVYAYGGSSYQWAPSNKLGCDTCQSATVNISATTTYTLTGWDVNGCKDMATTTVYYDNGSDVYGTITTAGGNPLTSSKVYLIKYNPIDSTLTALDSMLTDGNGEYSFETQEPEVYVKAAPDSASYPNEMPTYYDSSLTWNNATKVTLQDCDSVEVNFATIAGNNPGGPGFISGKLSEGAGKSLWSGDPIAGATLFLMNDGGEPVTYVVTDGEGWFEIESIPIGEYTLIGDIPMLDNEVPPVISLTDNNSGKDSLIIKKVDNRLEINDPTGKRSTSREKLSVQIRPNPASDRLYLKLDGANEVTNLVIYNSVGRKILQRQDINGQEEIQTESFPPGLYYLAIKVGEQRIIEKVQIVR